MRAFAPFLTPCITAAMRAATRRLTLLYDEVMAPSGLRVTQYHILLVLKHLGSDPPTIGELADLLTMDRSAMSRTLRPLERDGLVGVSRDTDDRRRRPVVLTSKGRNAEVRGARCWTQAHQLFGDHFGGEPLGALRATLYGIAGDKKLSRVLRSQDSSGRVS